MIKEIVVRNKLIILGNTYIIEKKFTYMHSNIL